MNARILPGRLAGTVAAPPSKSDAHRLIIAAALADRPMKLRRPGASEDVQATVRCLNALGARITGDGGALLVTPICDVPQEAELDCGESGSTLRFLLPVAAALAPCARLTGSAGLARRPLAALCESLHAGGARFSARALPLSVWGGLKSGRYPLPGDVSSQFVSGLLFALPLLPGESEIVLTSPLQSAGYVEMTLATLRRFNITWAATPHGWRTQGPQHYGSPGTLSAEGDWSGAAFLLAAGALGGPVTVTGLNPASPQRDRAFPALLAQFGASVAQAGDAVTVSAGRLRGCRIDISDIPDLAPALAVVAAAASGTTVLEHAARLRLKESDRLATLAALLHGLGVQAVEREDALVIQGGAGLCGGHVESFGDHRIAMAASIAATAASGPVLLADAMAVRKSYPGFFGDFMKLGGQADGVQLW